MLLNGIKWPFLPKHGLLMGREVTLIVIHMYQNCHQCNIIFLIYPSNAKVAKYVDKKTVKEYKKCAKEGSEQ